MPTESPNLAHQDEQAVEAVKRGDAERFRELVERHERRVYAVAWSRLGDATLAEDATQEAFIRGYRYLRLLGEGGKFAAWITSIARNVAINLGIRHRRELSKRQRWALEQDGAVETGPAGETHEQSLPVNLHAALADLPDAQRECLVLFYFEGKSGADAAATLRISEAAFRVRLHRARAGLRERLEERLGESLGQLRPARPIAPSVMGAILSSSTAKTTAGAGIGAKVLSSLAKTSLFSWFVPLLSIIGVVPGLGLAWWLGNVDRRNYREADGFRARLHRGFFLSFLWGFPLLVVLIGVLNRSALATWGIKGMDLASGCFVLVITLISARSLTIRRNRYQVITFAYCAIITAGIFALALGWIPQSLSQLPLLVATILFALALKHRPARMDYNLFLRAAQGLLKLPDATDETSPPNRLDRQTLLAFARFLGSRWLTTNFRWETRGLALRLPPVKTTFARNMAITLVPMSRRCSFILLGWDRTVIAHCSERDAADLDAPNPTELENVVAKAVTHACQEFRAGNHVSAEHALGQVPDCEVFVVPVAKYAATRWWRRILIGWVAFALALLTLIFIHPPWMEGMKPVDVTEQEVRATLAGLAADPPTLVYADGSLYLGFGYNFVMPPTDFFTADALRAVRQAVFRGAGFDLRRDEQARLHSLQHPYLQKAILIGWVGWDDIGLKPQDAAKYLQQNKEETEWQSFLVHGESWSWVAKEKFPVMRIYDLGLTKLEWFRDMNCLDFVDREALIQQIASVQVLSNTPSAGQPPIHDWKNVRGLFHTPSWPTLQDTYRSLAALEILGGLDRIDREACIQGILKHHRGRGYFTSPDPGGYNEYKIEGDARDTFCAFESLRILNALDRVNDLDRWQFRLARRSRSNASATPRKVTWEEIEVWVCQQRFGQFLRERKVNPQSPARSLASDAQAAQRQ